MITSILLFPIQSALMLAVASLFLAFGLYVLAARVFGWIGGAS